MKKKYFLTSALLLLCGMFFSLTVFANAPAPPSYFYYHVENPPAEAAFVDLLGLIGSGGEGYRAFNPEDEWAGRFSKDAPIVTYSEGGYQSIRFHYPDFSAWGEVDSGGFTGSQSTVSLDQVTPSVKIVLADEKGNILSVSEAVSLTPPDKEQFPRGIRYDAASNRAEIDFNTYYKGYRRNSFLFPLLAAILLRMVLSVGCEILFALPFKLRPLWKILVVNLVTQVLLIVFMTQSGMNYNLALVLGEVFVFLAESTVYCLLFHDRPKRVVILYTLCANTLTLCMGLLFNALHILG